MSTAPDLPRLRRDRHRKLASALVDHGIDALVLLGQQNVTYATGARVPAADAARAAHRRAVAVVTADGSAPHLFTWYPQGAPPELPADHVHAPFELEWEAGAHGLLDVLPPGTVALDEYTMPLRALLREQGRQPADVTPILGAAKVRKTVDELACIRHAQRINEQAIDAVEELVRPGVRTNELSGRFLRMIFELGATANTVDPIWQVMPPALSAGPFSTTGGLVFPLPTDGRELAEGDVVLVDTGLNYEGYASDFGATFVVGGAGARHREQAARWRQLVDRCLELVKPGATAGDLVRAATSSGGPRPWPPHLYLAHGIGTDSAEAPLVGTDLGPAFDDSLVLAPGMVLVFEPVVWEDGSAGFRAEEIVAVTDDGYERLSAPDRGPRG